MAFELLPATPADIPGMVTIHMAAFADDPIMGHLLRDVEHQVELNYHKDFYGKHFKNAYLTGALFHKVVERETEEIVAFAKWCRPMSLTPEQQGQREALDKNQQYPDGANKPLYAEFFGKLVESRKQFVDDSKDYFMHMLAVSPTHQRQGLGSMLLEEGLRSADRDGARCYIEASPKGLELYKKHGWEEVAEIVIDMDKYGGSGIMTEKCLMRMPGTGVTGSG